MNMMINRSERDTIYDGLMTDLTALDDVYTHLHHDESADARRLWRRFAVELRLLDDLGWEQEPDAKRFELTLPARELRPIIERIYWSSVSALSDKPDELLEDARETISSATVACPEILARLAEDGLPDPDTRQDAGLAETASE
jgi:hypothetical protein